MLVAQTCPDFHARQLVEAGDIWQWRQDGKALTADRPPTADDGGDGVGADGVRSWEGVPFHTALPFYIKTAGVDRIGEDVGRRCCLCMDRQPRLPARSRKHLIQQGMRLVCVRVPFRLPVTGCGFHIYRNRMILTDRDRRYEGEVASPLRAGAQEIDDQTDRNFRSVDRQ